MAETGNDKVVRSDCGCADKGQQQFTHLFHGHSSSEDGGNSQVSSVTWVTGGHHVLGVEHLLRQLWNGQPPILLTAAGCEWSKARHEEVETRERNHVDGQLTKIGVQLERKYLKHHINRDASYIF